MATITHPPSMKFILSRVDDRASHSKKWIVGHALLFWLATRIIAAGLVIACTAIYAKLGITHNMLPEFGGTPKAAATLEKLLQSLAMTTVIAPVFEEIVFRLGLSFKKWQVALNLAAIPLLAVYMNLWKISLLSAMIWIILAVIIFATVYRLTSQDFWNNVKSKWFVTAVWFTSIAFGLIHLRAFSFFSLEMLPYMLCMISIPFFGGCACAYLRVNLGFGWGLAMHIFNNLPGIFIIIAMHIN